MGNEAAAREDSKHFFFLKIEWQYCIYPIKTQFIFLKKNVLSA